MTEDRKSDSALILSSVACPLSSVSYFAIPDRR